MGFFYSMFYFPFIFLFLKQFLTFMGLYNQISKTTWDLDQEGKQIHQFRKFIFYLAVVPILFET